MSFAVGFFEKYLKNKVSFISFYVQGSLKGQLRVLLVLCSKSIVLSI